MSKTSTLLFRFCFIVIGCPFLTLAQGNRHIPALIPAPASMEMRNGQFVFSSRTLVVTDNPEDKSLSFFTRYLKQYGNIHNKIVHSLPSKHPGSLLVITSQGAEKLPPEGYELDISSKQVKLTGRSAGIFYGIQTLIQMMPENVNASSFVLPALSIKDQPRFGYRGLMLDVSRHFFTVQQIKDLLDLMAIYKLNRFHWHLTDDQGWRIEIKSFPKLTSVGAWRVPRPGDFGRMDPPRPGEPATDGGFYTQNQVRDIIQFAAERYIQVIPEIDVPGHSMAMIAAYPELCCTKDTSIKVNPGNSFARWFGDGKFEMYTDNTLNPSDEKVYQFLDKVFTEVASLFPYEYIHIGGDECYKGYWEKDPGVQAFMKKMNITNTHELQLYFTKRVCRIIRSKHKIPIGWDEIGAEGLDGEVAMMSRWESNGMAALQQKHNVVKAPGGGGLYFDYAQSSFPQEPISHGGFAPLWKTYEYNPAPDSLTGETQNYILGVQACVWTEHIPTVAKLQYMVLPRMLALAETGWTPVKVKNYTSFSENRLPVHLAWLDAKGMNYRVPAIKETPDTTMIGSDFRFDLKPTVAGAKIFYTLDGLPPTDADHEYDSSLILHLAPNTRKELQVIEITPAGRRSFPSRIMMYNQTPLAADKENNINETGLKYQIRKGDFSSIDQMNCAALSDSGITVGFNSASFRNSAFGMSYEGYFKADADGIYIFSVLYNNAARLFIDDRLIIDQDKGGAEKQAPVSVLKGFHKIRVQYLNKTGTGNIKVYVSTIGKQKQEIPESVLFH